jgi:hypothetical protein
MALQNVLPIPGFPGFQWSNVVSNQVQEIVTTLNAESLDALNEVPEREIAWADRGSKVSPGVGIVKVPIRLPSSMQYEPFAYGGTRTYQNIDIAAPVVKVNPWDLNFAWPMVWNQIGNGMNLMSQMADGSIGDFMGVSGLAQMIVSAARAYKAQLVASLFYKGLTSSAMGLTAQALTIPQPGNPNGLPLFTNGTDSVKHYAHPFNANSGRFANSYEAYGSFATKFASSLVVMTQKPHPSLPNMTMGKQVTDVFGPTWMRDRFFAMATQTLQLQVQTVGGQAAGGAPTNAFALENLRKYNADSFIGASGFAPQTYWIVPALDNHPYFTNNSNANMTTGPNGGPADMWINVSAETGGKQTWCELAAPTKDFTPNMRLYGDNDPLSQSQRRVRLETDLDAGVGAGLYHFIDMFFGV